MDTSRSLGNRSLTIYVSLGLFAGASYVVFDVMAEARLRAGTLIGPLASAHNVVDHVLPLAIGALLGVAAHYTGVRARLTAAEEAASRAEALRARLQKVERDQAVWVLAAAVLHELNNPLHALGLLLDEIAASENDAERRADLVARAQGQADRALSPLRVLRSMRSVGEPEVGQVALHRVLRALADDLSPLADEEGLAVRVVCAHPVHASADPAYVRTIVENLVDNSLHSLRTNGGGAITISLDVEGGEAIVRVFDDGSPLGPVLDDSVFEPLRSTKRQGLGLGLAISRALARAMGGDLLLDAHNPNGFRLELPLGERS